MLTENEKSGDIFIWKTENYSHCIQQTGEPLGSPIFTSRTLDKTKCLCLYPRGMTDDNSTALELEVDTLRKELRSTMKVKPVLEHIPPLTFLFFLDKSGGEYCIEIILEESRREWLHFSRMTERYSKLISGKNSKRHIHCYQCRLDVICMQVKALKIIPFLRLVKNFESIFF
ncbi:hypothetical protein JTE90_008947 [Oedothorax gibbosus]|uniref:Uncharacterized protein n=1 Tax=Oedothorax gibbosus TaxID=931172 RepID=A0AAV6UMN3_9ARAC|nr:hypothetical protein JTE90_008947 [Oedothorax gibbosus]